MNRRRLIQSFALAPFAGTASAGPRRTDVILTGLETFVVKVNHRGNWVFVRLNTNVGVTGIGEASHGGSDERVVRLAGQFFERIKGRGIYEIEWLRQSIQPAVVQYGRPAAVAFSALEQCLWDIQGKVAGVPAYQLFGGKLHSRLRNYANINRATVERTPQGFAEMAERAVKDGFDAIKLAPFDGMPRDAADPRFDELEQLGIDCARAVRNAIGEQAALMVDAHSYFDLNRGLLLAQKFEPLNLFWLEEVTPREPSLESLAAINQATGMPTAGGESMYGVREFYRYIEAEAVDILMPDVKYCGGMLELKKISAMAEGAGMPVAPHGPAGPVANIAAAHVCAGLPNFQILEFAYGEVPWRAELIEPPEELENGFLTVLDRPGLGIALNEPVIQKHQL